MGVSLIHRKPTAKLLNAIVNYLLPDNRYRVKQMDGKIIATLSGNDLKKTGFQVLIDKLYDGELFEISSK